jgi:hypothetical protein
MQRHFQESMREARDHHMKRREGAKFFFLKGGLDKQSDRTRTGELRGRPVHHRQTEIAAAEDALLQSAESFEVRREAYQSLSNLMRLAHTGNPMMVGVLHCIAVEMISALYAIAMEKTEVVRSIARRQFAWPALIGRKRSFKQTNERLMQILQLGEGDVFSRRGWQPSAPSNLAALDLFQTARFYEEDWNLPSLTEKTKRTWFQVAWDQML